jgi:hypothetical protein
MSVRWQVTSKMFSGEIDVLGIDLTASNNAAIYIDFNGQFG